MRKKRVLTEIHAAAAVLKNSLRIESAHYDRNCSREVGRALFQRHVELIEIETTSYCNRACSFCPNSFIDRRNSKSSMPEAAWTEIVRGLRELDFDGTIVWSRYSEPLSEERLTERIREVRMAAPRARIAVNSNGDFLDEGYLQRLVTAGLTRLWVDAYVPDEQPCDPEHSQRHLDHFLNRLAGTAAVVRTEPELVANVFGAGIELTVHVRNLATIKALDMSDRGGLISYARRTVRESPCFAPFKHLVVDWDGSVVACCQLRSDTARHKLAVVGRIGVDGTGLVEAYVALADWRRSLRAFGPKVGPCATCNVSEYSSTRANRLVGRLFADEQLPGVRIAKHGARLLIPKAARP